MRTLDLEKTTLQETGEVYLQSGISLAQAWEIVNDLGLDPKEIVLSQTVLRVKMEGPFSRRPEAM